MIVDHGIVSPVNVSDVDPPEEEDTNEDDNNGPKMELSVRLYNILLCVVYYYMYMYIEQRLSS